MSFVQTESEGAANGSYSSYLYLSFYGYLN